MRGGLRLAKNALPFVVSAVILAYLLTRIDARSVVSHLSPRAIGILLPALLVYGAVSLWLEALSLLRLVDRSGAATDWWTCARIKGASYPLGMINYALGAGTLSVLLNRRAGMPGAEAAGIVILIAALDLGILLVLSAAGAALLSARAPGLQIGVLVAAAGAIALGFAVLRTRRFLGPLERLRGLSFLAPLRSAPLALLLEVGFLRLLFVLAFVALVWSALQSFGVSVPVGDLVVNVAAVTLVATIPLAISGLGTGQVAFVYLFRHWGEADLLLACSLALSMGLISLRVGIGLVFAREFTREAMAAVRRAES